MADRSAALAWACYLVLAPCARVNAAPLRAAVAKVEITPPAGLPMWGYAARTRPAEGVMDPLYARILLLEGSGKRVALVVLDLGRSLGAQAQEALRTRAAAIGVLHVLTQGTHTHAGPMLRDRTTGDEAEVWEKQSLDKITRALEEAAAGLVEARIGVGSGSVFIGHNRIREGADGRITMMWRNETRAPTSPVDPTITVLRIDTAAGRPLAVLVNHACHPVILGPDNLHYSADFPGVMCRVLEQSVEGKPMAFFLQGAPGDIDPYYALTRLEMDPKFRLEATGSSLGEAAARVARGIRTEGEPEGGLQFIEDKMRFRARWQKGQTHRGGESESFDLPVTTLLLNRRIAFVTLPGEPFVDLQIDWRSRNPLRDTFFLGYVNGYHGYFPTIATAARGGYGAASTSTWVEVGAGERMVNQSLIRIYEMLGKLVGVPEDARKK